MFAQQIPQGSCTAAMNPCDWHGVLLCGFHCTLNHFVGNGVGEQNHQIRRADFLFQRAGFLWKYLCLTAVFLTDVRIFPAHAFVSTDNYNAHKILLVLDCVKLFFVVFMGLSS